MVVKGEIYPEEVRGRTKCKNCPDGIEERQNCFHDWEWQHVYYNSLGRVISATRCCPNPYRLPMAEPDG